MLKRLLGILAPKPNTSAEEPVAFQLEPPARLEVEGVEAFDFAASLVVVNDLPVPDWQKVGEWVDAIGDAPTQARAWSLAELGWLAHLQQALGGQYHLTQHQHAMLLSPLEPRVAKATVEYMTKTLTRVTRVLDGIARAPDWGRDILLIFEHEEDYYRYVARYYAHGGEFSVSGGMHIHQGCGHFATYQAEMRTIEPVIAHEMTHGCLAHLPIPAWLNEGLAVNTERKLSPPLAVQHTPHQLHLMHQRFWNAERIQEFWLGTSFMRPDDGNLLSYELGRILVENFAADWERFKTFALQANLADAGAAAAESVLGVRLGTAVCALFGAEPSPEWEPQPASWQAPPEKGAFYRAHSGTRPREATRCRAGQFAGSIVLRVQERHASQVALTRTLDSTVHAPTVLGATGRLGSMPIA